MWSASVVALDDWHTLYLNNCAVRLFIIPCVVFPWITLRTYKSNYFFVLPSSDKTVSVAKNWLPFLEGFDFFICCLKLFRKVFPVSSYHSTGVNTTFQEIFCKFDTWKELVKMSRTWWFCPLNFELNKEQHNSPSCALPCHIYFWYKQDSGVVQLAKTVPLVTKNVPLLRFFLLDAMMVWRCYTPYDVNDTNLCILTARGRTSLLSLLILQCPAEHQTILGDERGCVCRPTQNDMGHWVLLSCVS